MLSMRRIAELLDLQLPKRKRDEQSENDDA